MKSLIYLSIFLSVVFSSVKAQVEIDVSRIDSAVYNKLMKMNFETYKNKSADRFFKDLGYTYKKCIPTSKKPGFISHVIFIYGDSVTVDIAVKNLGQKEPLNFNYKFDVNVFKTKKIDWLCFKYAGECIKGCEEEYCK